MAWGLAPPGLRSWPRSTSNQRIVNWPSYALITELICSHTEAAYYMRVRGGVDLQYFGDATRF